MTTNTNYIRHLNAFFARVQQDDRLRPHHISLYLALFQVWNQQRFQDSFPIKRKETMALSCIGSRSTYVDCLKELHQFGYITYQPGRPYQPCLIQVRPLAAARNADPSTSQLLLFQELKVGGLELEPTAPVRPKNEPLKRSRSEPCTWPKIAPHMWPGNGPLPGPKVGPFIYKHINNKKTESINTRSCIKKIKKNTVKNSHREPVIPPPAAAPAVAPPAPPSLQEVQQFFQLAGYPDTEARKFFYHYQASGWRLGGHVLITHWPAAAHKWMLNVLPPKTQQHATTQRNTLQPGGLHVNEDKNYAEPI